MAQLTLVIMLPSQVTLEIIITSQASYFQGISDLVPFRYMVDPSFSFYPFFILRFYCRYDLFFLKFGDRLGFGGLCADVLTAAI